MPAFEPLAGLRVVAEPDALDRARWKRDGTTEPVILRVAPDEAVAIGARSVELDDEHAIVTDERGMVGSSCRVEELEHRVEWPLPIERPALAQGALAGVPARIWLVDGEHALVVTWAAYAHDLADRLGWSILTDPAIER